MPSIFIVITARRLETSLSAKQLFLHYDWQLNKLFRSNVLLNGRKIDSFASKCSLKFRYSTTLLFRTFLYSLLNWFWDAATTHCLLKRCYYRKLCSKFVRKSAFPPHQQIRHLILLSFVFAKTPPKTLRKIFSRIIFSVNFPWSGRKNPFENDSSISMEKCINIDLCFFIIF